MTNTRSDVGAVSGSALAAWRVRELPMLCELIAAALAAVSRFDGAQAWRD